MNFIEISLVEILLIFVTRPIPLVNTNQASYTSFMQSREWQDI